MANSAVLDNNGKVRLEFEGERALFRPEEVKLTEGGPKAPERECKKCSSTLEFDWLESEYFSFITDAEAL